MDTNETKQQPESSRLIVLFDLDGVIIDTEGIYSEFWNRMGNEFINRPDLGPQIKGQTLPYILDTHFPGRPDIHAKITERLDNLEATMPYNYIAGAEQLIEALAADGVPMAIVTSSTEQKLKQLLKRHPEIKERIPSIFTSEMFTRSKPFPDCYLMGMEKLGGTPATTVVMEDSISGLKAAHDSGAFVVGLTTTYPVDQVEPLAHVVVPNLTRMTPGKLRRFVADRRD